jgi:hypothetical protein
VRRLALAVAVALAAAACGPGKVVRQGRINEDALAVVRQRLPPVRGLEFRAPVAAVALSPEEIREFLARDLERDYQPGDLERLTAVCTRLGLLPEGTDLRTTFARLYADEGAGFYDPRAKRLVLATQGVKSGAGTAGLKVLGAVTGRDYLGEFIVAHELTHALQDQHFGLPTTPEPLVGGDGDRRLALHALAEGDATLAGLGYMMGRAPEGSVLARLERELHKMPAELAERYPDVPPLVRESVAFVYDGGATFVGRALDAGGFAAVDALYADPPASSEQILHPERYFDRRDPPRAVAIGGTDGLERSGFVRTFDGPLGEFHVRLLAARVLPPADASRIAEGWGGDRLRALARGEELVLVWLTAWDSADEAAEFQGALPGMLPDAAVERRGDRVLAVLAPAGGGLDVRALAARVWTTTR